MKEYLYKFEKEVLIKLFETELYSINKIEPVSLKKSKLLDIEFGDFIGPSFEYKDILTFDYYGLFKISKGIIKAQNNHNDMFPGVKVINSPVIHFSSIKKEQVLHLAPSLFEDFIKFKEYLVKLRWNK